MGIICKKCDYERKPEETISEQECPNCGVLYFKYDTWLQKQAAKHGVSEQQILDAAKAKAKADMEKFAKRREQTAPDTNPSVTQPSAREKIIQPTIPPSPIATTTPIVTTTLDSELVASNRTLGTERQPTTTPTNNVDIPDLLKKWAELRDTGAITDAEFTQKKNEILSSPDAVVPTAKAKAKEEKSNNFEAVWGLIVIVGFGLYYLGGGLEHEVAKEMNKIQNQVAQHFGQFSYNQKNY